MDWTAWWGWIGVTRSMRTRSVSAEGLEPRGGGSSPGGGPCVGPSGSGKFPVGSIVVAVEHGRWSLLYLLMVYEFLILVPINPRASKAYRDSLRPEWCEQRSVRRGVDLDFVMKHLSELRVWKPDDPITRKLRLSGRASAKAGRPADRVYAHSR